MDNMLDKNGKTFKEYMSTYNADEFKHPSLAVDVVLFTENHGKLEVVLVKRDEHPFVGCWATPGSFVGYSEDLDEAAERTIRNKAGIYQEQSENGRIYFRQLHTFGKVDRDPRTRVVSVGYMSLIPRGYLDRENISKNVERDIFKISLTKIFEGVTKSIHVLTLQGENTDTVIQYRITENIKDTWVDVESTLDSDVSTGELAGDHIKIIFTAIKRLQSLSKNMASILNILPEYFTLGDAQRIFESVSGKTFAPANFRKKVLDDMLVIMTDKTTTYRSREVRLYTANRKYSSLD